MFKSFEIKSYPQLNFALGLVNALLMAAALIATYFFVLTPKHLKSVDGFLAFMTQDKIHDSVSMVAVSVLWGWISTHFLCLHDRIHEPHIRMWRSQYDADFVLRSLLAEVRGSIPEEFFARAYHDKRIRKRLIQRLFYNFVGDETSTASGRRLFFYTEMWKYWTLALIDLYASVYLVVFPIYHMATGSAPTPGLVLSLGLVIILARIGSNPILNGAHEITEEQIAAVKRQHAEELESEAIAVATEIGL